MLACMAHGDGMMQQWPVGYGPTGFFFSGWLVWGTSEMHTRLRAYLSVVLLTAYVQVFFIERHLGVDKQRVVRSLN